MKKVLIAVGSVLLLSGAIAGFVYGVQIPTINFEIVDWLKRTVSVNIRGKEYSFTATSNLASIAPVPFSKYSLSFIPDPASNGDIWKLFISDGVNPKGTVMYFDFSKQEKY